MPRRSEFTEAVLDLVSEIQLVKKEAAKSKAIPFMQEELSKRDARNRFQASSPEERRRFIEAHGLQEAMKLVQDGP